MITNTQYYISRQTVPYRNIAIEEYLLNKVEHGSCIFYLWQNRQTVVIGKNQNSFKECKVGMLEEEGGFLARRLSGGGAVFHDLGNLNFTFLVHEEDYDVKKQLQVIVNACRSFGIDAEQTGRNDIIADGRKFSGNAFYQTGSRCYHHGTIMIRVDMDYLSRYLNVSLKKLRSKGVDSVRSRVTNLSDFNPDVNIETMTRALIESFAGVYGCIPTELTDTDLDQTEVQRLTDKFASDEWKFGAAIPFTASLNERYPWGEIELQFVVKDNIISQLEVFSDAMDADFIPKFRSALQGLPFRKAELIGRLDQIESENELQAQIRSDVISLIGEQL